VCEGHDQPCRSTLMRTSDANPSADFTIEFFNGVRLPANYGKAPEGFACHNLSCVALLVSNAGKRKRRSAFNED